MLNGIRIIEIEGLGPTPFAGMLFSDLGAEVTVIHRKDKSDFSNHKNILDRGKRSIELNLKDPDDLVVAKKLIIRSDAVIEGFRPGVMEKLGLGPNEFSENPSLVFGRMTGWGQDGPKSKQAGHDLNYIGLSGALWFASHPNTPPFTPPALVGDVGGGALYLVIGVLSAMLNAKESGKGSIVDAAIVDGSAHMMNLFMSLQNTGMLSEDRGKSLLDGPPWSRCYRTLDDLWISVQCLEPKFYSEFLEVMDLSDHSKFKNQLNKENWKEMTEILEDHFLKKSLQEWIKIFDQTDSCVAPVLSPSQSKNDPHMDYRKTWVDDDGLIQASAAPRFNNTREGIGKIPERGEHKDLILSELNEEKL
tara:strand:+ start:343 stop:1425 length:1083 start_codon:yes stop_codon:yes gene_type:complete